MNAETKSSRGFLRRRRARKLLPLMLGLRRRR